MQSAAQGVKCRACGRSFRRPGDLKSAENQKGSVQCSRSKRCKRSLAVHKCRPELHNATECMATTPPLQEGHVTKFFGSGHGRTRCVCVWGGGGLHWVKAKSTAIATHEHRILHHLASNI